MTLLTVTCNYTIFSHFLSLVTIHGSVYTTHTAGEVYTASC